MQGMDITNKKIVICGGGPSGLSMARILQIHGFKYVTIVERDIDRSVRVGGSSLDLHSDSGLILIEKANLMKEFKELSRPEGESITISDKNANVILHKPHMKIQSQKPEIDRGVLRNMLIDSLNPNTILWDYHFDSLNELDDGRIKINFKNGKDSIIADLLIGADGANSKIRKYVAPDLKIQYSGITLIEFEVENPDKVCPEVYNWVDKGLFYVLSDEKGFIVQLKGDGNLIIYLSCKRSENWIKDSGLDFKKDFEEIKKFIKSEVLSDWDKVFHGVVDHAMFPFVPRPLYSIPIDDSVVEWQSKSNITLIGDAAHTIVPYAGKGLNSGLMDAVELVECLLESTQTDKDSNIISPKLNNYEVKMQKRMLEIATDSLDAQEIVHSKDACNQLVNRFLGPYYKYFKSILPYYIYTANYFTDLFGWSK